MAINVGNRPDTRPRELGRRGGAGSFVAAFGLMWTVSYVAVMSWITSLVVDSMYYFWQFTMAFGWTIMLGGVIIFAVGVGLMLSDWKRREPEPRVVQMKEKEKVKRATGYDATQQQMEYHIEA
jgi:hypothetical protein